MTLAITVDVQCDADGCLEWAHGATSHGRPHSGEARAAARKQGWTRSRVSGKWNDLCPRASRLGRG